MDLLRIDRRREGGWTVVTAVGQLDVATAPRLEQELQQASGRGEHLVVVDLEGVEFVDSFGLGVLVGGLKRTRANGGRFVVACTRDRTLRLLEMSGLERTFEVVAAPSDATK